MTPSDAAKHPDFAAAQKRLRELNAEIEAIVRRVNQQFPSDEGVWLPDRNGRLYFRHNN